MSDETHELNTDQAEREASGAHNYGRYLKEFQVVERQEQRARLRKVH
jgi:hypothetical protein